MPLAFSANFCIQILPTLQGPVQMPIHHEPSPHPPLSLPAKRNHAALPSLMADLNF